MPMLSQHVVASRSCVALDHAIVASIPPETMAQSLSIMLPAMNVEDRSELLGGMQAAHRPRCSPGSWGSTESVLEPVRFDALARRLGD